MSFESIRLYPILERLPMTPCHIGITSSSSSYIIPTCAPTFFFSLPLASNGANHPHLAAPRSPPRRRPVGQLLPNPDQKFDLDKHYYDDIHLCFDFVDPHDHQSLHFTFHIVYSHKPSFPGRNRNGPAYSAHL